MKVMCPVCEKVVSAYVPKGGDGSALRPYRHGDCDGRFELVAEIYSEAHPTQRARRLVASTPKNDAIAHSKHDTTGEIKPAKSATGG